MTNPVTDCAPILPCLAPGSAPRKPSRQGSISVETAVLLALVVAAVGVTIWGLGISTQKLFSQASKKLEQSLDSSQSQNDPTMVPTADSSVTNSTQFVGKLVIVLTVMALGGTLGYRLSTVNYRRQVRKKEGNQFTETSDPLAEKNRKRLFAKRDQTMAILNRQLGLAAFDEMQVGHLMSKNVNTVLLATPLTEVREWIIQYRYRHLLVCDSYGKLVGIISDRDVQRVDSGTAGDMMTANPITVSSNQPVSPVITLMMDRKISSVPVVDNDKIVGILTTTDLMIALQCTLHLVKSIGELALAPSLPKRGDPNGDTAGGVLSGDIPGRI